MKISTKNVLFLICLLLGYTSCSRSVCSCNKYIPPVTNEGKVTPAPSSINVDGINYGTPMIIGSQIFLRKKISYNKPAYTVLPEVCPSGFKTPTFEELNSVFAEINYSYLQLYDVLSLYGFYKAIFLTKTKVHETEVSRDFRSWMFKGFLINTSLKRVDSYDANTYWDTGMYVICMKDSAIQIEGNPDTHYVGKGYEMKVIDKNIYNTYFYFNDKIHMGSSMTYEFNRSGCYTINVFASDLTGKQIQSCFEIYVEFPMGSEENVKFNVEGIVKTGIENSVLKFKNMFYLFGNPVLATSEEGLLFAAFTGEDGYLKVAKINETSKSVQVKNTEKKGLAIDILVVRHDVVLYYQKEGDKNHSGILYFDVFFREVFNTTVMNNGDMPTKATDQVSFLTENDVPVAGTSVMFVANKGKLAQGFDKISLIFSHYSHFGMIDGKRDDHQGDSLYFFNKKTGEPDSLGWGWNTSHSMDQEQIFDGRYFITASLGDVYPENIRVCAVDPRKISSKTFTKDKSDKEYKCIDAVEGVISGDGKGFACGRLGNIILYKDHFYLLYSRRKCSEKVFTPNPISEVALLKMKVEDGEPKVVKKYVISQNADNIHNLRAERYGATIVILYSEYVSTATIHLSLYHYGHEDVYVMQVDFEGRQLAEPKKLTSDSIPVGTSMKQGRNGDIHWLTVNDQGTLLLHSVHVANPVKEVHNPRIGLILETDISGKEPLATELQQQEAIIYEQIQPTVELVSRVAPINFFNEAEGDNTWKSLFQ